MNPDSQDQTAIRSEEELLVVQGMPLLGQMSNTFKTWGKCDKRHDCFGVLQKELVTVDKYMGKYMSDPFKYPNGRDRFAKFLKALSIMSVILLAVDPLLDLLNISSINKKITQMDKT